MTSCQIFTEQATSQCQSGLGQDVSQHVQHIVPTEAQGKPLLANVQHTCAAGSGSWGGIVLWLGVRVQGQGHKLRQCKARPCPVLCQGRVRRVPTAAACFGSLYWL